MALSALSGPYAGLLPPGNFTFDDNLFDQLTTQEQRDGDAITIPTTGGGFGQAMRIRIPPVGVVASVILDFVGTITTVIGAGHTMTANPRWPYGLLSAVTLRINGRNTDYDTTGIDLRVLRFMRTRNVTDSLDVSTFTGATPGATSNIRASWEIPFNLSEQLEPSGGLFAQAANTEIDLALMTASAAELFAITSPDTVTIAGTITPRIRWYDVPVGQIGNNQQGLILPTLDSFHVLKHQTLPLPGGGKQTVRIDHVDGSLMRLWTRITNGAPGAAEIAPNPGSIDLAEFRYGTSQAPISASTDQLIRAEDRRYRGRPPYNALVIVDATDNLVRDRIQLATLTDPALSLTVDPAVTVNAGAQIDVAYEVLIPLIGTA